MKRRKIDKDKRIGSENGKAVVPKTITTLNKKKDTSRSRYQRGIQEGSALPISTSTAKDTSKATSSANDSLSASTQNRGVSSKSSSSAENNPNEPPSLHTQVMGERKPRTQKNNPERWVPKFLEHLAEWGLMGRAREAAGITRKIYDLHHESNPYFREKVEEALEESVDKLERVARERAIEYSDPLMQFLLKGRRPQVFSDRVTVTDERKLTVRVEKLAEEYGLEPQALLEMAKSLVEDSSIVEGEYKELPSPEPMRQDETSG